MTLKKPVVDYRQFRISRLNEPSFAHLKYLLVWPCFFLLFVLTEKFIPADACRVVHSPVDDIIPFNELFIIPYVFWYVLIFISLVYFGFYDPQSLKKLMQFIFVTMIICMAVYVVYPTRQELRPESFARDNIFTRLVGLIYSVDTNTGVCPSLHVAWSLGMASAWTKSRPASRLWKCFVVIVAVLICASVVFVKQHSVVDIWAALPVALLAEILVYGRDFWQLKFKNKKQA